MDPDGTIAPLLLTLFILVAASAFFSMCESAMVTLSDSRLKRLVEDGDNRARKLLDKLDPVSYTHLDVYKRQERGLCGLL